MKSQGSSKTTTKKLVSDEFIEATVKNNFAMGMDGIWFNVYPHLASEPDEAKEKFLFVMETLLSQGKVKLADKGKFLEGTIEEQIQIFRDSWPPWDNFDEDLFYVTANPDEFGIYDLWPPGGLVWFGDDGYIHWT